MIEINDVHVEKERILDTIKGNDHGLVLICLVGIHGNEQAGILAVKQIFRKIREKNLTINGEIIAINGNINAIKQNKRFIDCDLNRIWTKEKMEEIVGKEELINEEQDLVSIKRVIDSYIETGRQIVILDMHTMSADGVPFVTFENTIENRKIAFNLPVPNIMGLINVLHGTLVGYYAEKHLEGIVFEGGQHSLSDSVLNTEAMIKQMMIIHGLVIREHIDPTGDYYKRLSSNHANYPHFVFVIHRHLLTNGDGFKMKAGYENLHKIKKGEVIATDNNGDITAPMAGRILLPLYQGQGDEGFFISKDISAWRLKLWTHIISFIKKHMFYPENHNRYFDKFK